MFVELVRRCENPADKLLSERTFNPTPRVPVENPPRIPQLFRAFSFAHILPQLFADAQRCTSFTNVFRS